MSVDFVKTKHGFHNQLGNEQEQRNGVIVAQYLWYDQRSQCQSAFGTVQSSNTKQFLEAKHVFPVCGSKKL